jgi:CheY-like chemotaxis protein
VARLAYSRSAVIVDDDEAAACAVARMLGALGYTVVAAAQDPAAGLAMVRATRCSGWRATSARPARSPTRSDD